MSCLGRVPSAAKTVATTMMSVLLFAPEQGNASLKVERVADGLDRPLYVAATASDPQHIYVLEHWTGKILRINPATESEELFFTVPGLSTGYSYGLVGMAFHPDYTNNGKFYVSIMTNGTPPISRIREYTVGAGGVPGSPRDLLVFQQPAPQHNNTWIAFGPDGMLYIASGDGGNQYGGQLPGGNPSQRLDTVFGKILRIDVNGQDAGLEYRIPDGSNGETPNPFIGENDSFGAPARGEVWVYGLRSPWRCSFDRLTDDLYIADVGQFEWEWIDFVPGGSAGGQNFGWCVQEGSHSTEDIRGMEHCEAETSTGGPLLPIYEYAHTQGRNCIIGGYVYRGSAIPGLQGTHFFADNGSEEIFSFRYDPLQGISDFADRTAELTPEDPDDPISPSSFGEDAAGELYVVSYESGAVYKIVPECACLSDLNSDGVRDGRDIPLFVGCVISAAPACACADVDGVLGPDLGDVAGFVDDLLAGSTCP